MSSIVAIVGRPNVGKSTLFNRLTETRDAIVDPTSGVTRDRKFGKATWSGSEFAVIDTGGYATHSDDSFEEVIRKQVLISIDEADLILFLVDIQTGITDLDQEVADIIRRSGKPTILVANKVDSSDKEFESAVFYGLGIGDQLFSISANNGYGTGDLLDEIIRRLPLEPEKEIDDSIPRLAVIGQPNVGKSSFINTLLGEERNIVTDIAGTTRDAVHTRYQAFGFDFILIDTAGLRKKNKIEDQIEFYSTVRTIRAVAESDVCLILIDASKEFTKQDIQIFFEALEQNKGVVLLVNKWDLVEKDTHTVDIWTKAMKERIQPFTDVPILFTSNLTKQRILKAVEVALEVYENRKRKIPTSQLNDVMQEIIQATPPPAIKGKLIRIKYVMQLPTRFPAFAFYCNHPQYIKEPYKRFLENKLRDNFNLTGTPVRIYFREK
jgi:GTP-binding protein